MAIIYNKEKRIFSLHTEHTTYQMMADTHDYLLHLYYGKRLDSEMDYILTMIEVFHEIHMILETIVLIP